MKHIEKRNIDELNIEEARGWVLDRANNLEKAVNRIIINYLEVPKDNQEKIAFADNMLLNSSIVSFGSKIKVLQNIIDSKKLIDNLRKFLAIRNGFAHAVVDNVVEVSMDKDSQQYKIDKVSKVINVMNAAGKIKTKSYQEYLKEFFELNTEIKLELQKLKKEGKI